MLFGYCAKKGGGGAGLYLYVDIVPSLVAFSREHTHLVTSCPAAKILRIPLGRSFHKYLEGLSHIGLVALQAEAVLQLDDLVKPSGLDIRGDIVGIVPGRYCARPRSRTQR